MKILGPEELDKLIKNQATHLLNCIEDEIRDKFKRYKDIVYNSGTKGTDCELIVKTALEQYLGSRFDFYNKAQVVDTKMDHLRIFNGESSELDIALPEALVRRKILLKNMMRKNNLEGITLALLCIVINYKTMQL
jgi:hypothetical protein